MWGDKEKPDSLLLGSHLGARHHHPAHLMGSMGPQLMRFNHPHHHLEPTTTHLHHHSSPHPPTHTPTVMWKGNTNRRRRFEAFCTPMVPHVPIRERLSRRGTSADVSDEMSNYTCYAPRRRRMSLLQSLRQQNKALADSGCELRHRADSESTRDGVSPQHKSPPTTPKKSLVNLKNRIFGKKEKEEKCTSSHAEYDQSSEPHNGRSQKSPSTTNDSGRGSQGHLEEKEQTGILEHVDEQGPSEPKHNGKHRTSSCPDLSTLHISGRTMAPLVDEESGDDDESSTKKPSPKEVRHRPPQQDSNFRRDVQMAMALSPKQDDSRFSPMSARTGQTEDLADFDDNVSSIVLDNFLSNSHLNFDEESCSDFSITGTIEDSEGPCPSTTTTTGTATSVQTDLSLLNIEQEVADILAKHQFLPDEDEGMNFIAKHFFEYQSFMNMAHKAVRLHKTPASQAGTDPSAGWAPKNMLKSGKNQAAPAARASRVHRDPRPNGTKYGRAGKHEHREWGDRHGELKEEKVAPHKDAWTKFLSNEEPGQRSSFECDFEDRMLQCEDDTLIDRLARCSPDSLRLPLYKGTENFCEVLIILTYAPTVQFITATVKKAKRLPFNNAPFARVMLFVRRHLQEQKQTTVNPSLLNKSEESCKPSSSSACSSSNSSIAVSSDASFSESFLFHVSPQTLDKVHIVIELYDHDDKGKVHKAGHCVIGSSQTDEPGDSHWSQMVRQHGLPCCMWHPLS